MRWRWYVMPSGGKVSNLKSNVGFLSAQIKMISSLSPDATTARSSSSARPASTPQDNDASRPRAPSYDDVTTWYDGKLFIPTPGAAWFSSVNF